MILNFLALFLWGQVHAGTLPEANLMITPSSGEINKEFTFDASASRNTHGTTSGLEFRFQFSNERAWTAWSGKSIQKFTPLDIGTFRARVQVRDKNSATTQTTYRNYRVMGDIYRRIWISVSPTRVRAGQPAYFELKLSLPRTEDPDAVQARWDFDSDGRWDSGWSRQKIVEHVYSADEVGQVSPTVEAKFPDGTVKSVRGIESLPTYRAGSNQPVAMKFWDKIQISSPAVTAPIINVSPGSEGYTEDTIFQFDASSSKIPRQAWLEWSFYGEQFVKGKEKVSHKFTSPGKHEVRVRTCYDRNSPKCAETTLIVNVKEDPLDYRAEISASNLTRQTVFGTVTSENPYFTAVVGDRIRFTASIRRYAGMGTRFTYRWDFEGDGQWDTTFDTSPSTEYVYPRSGQFTPTLQVQNEDLISVSSSVRLNIVASTAPTASFTVDTRRIYVGEKVRFFPKVKDLQTPSNQLEVRFDADGDEVWDMPFKRITSYEWKYESAGNYVARMQVRDISGKVSTVSRMVTVFGSEPPQAKVTVSQRYGDTKTTFVFDASNSIGRDLRYIWDFDFQGPQDLISQGQNVQTSLRTVTKQFSTAGEKQIGLRVIDALGNEDQIHFPVWVSKYMLQAVPMSTEQNLHTENLYPPDGAVPVTSEVPSMRISSSDTNLKTLQPRPVQTDRSMYVSDNDSLNGLTTVKLYQPERVLVRADMFFFLYEYQLHRPPFQLQELPPLPPNVLRYGADHNILPFLTQNPFEDVKENDWFYMAGLLSYRDGFSQKPFFHPAVEIDPDEASEMVKIFTGKTVDFGESVTRQEFRDALHS